jgi:parallel beta-helix repeat protein
LTDNQISNTKDTAVQITSSSKNIFLANRITNGFRGFILSESPSNLLANNQFKNMEWGLYVESETKEGFDNSINESNVVDQVPIVYLFGKSGGQIQDRKLAHLTLAYCDNVTVKNTTITRDAVFLYDSKNIKILNNDISECFGMRLVKSFENEISGNRLLGNKYSGIFLYGSDLNQIGENNLSLNNQNGISLLSCRQNTIRDNVVEGNNDTGVWLNLSNDNQIDQNNISRNAIGCQIESSTGNKIFHNNFLNNKEQSQDVKGNNSWDDGNVSGGNHWNDHVAKGNPSNNWPRQIKGGIMQDRYPFQSESGWLAARAAASSSMAKA